MANEISEDSCSFRYDFLIDWKAKSFLLRNTGNSSKQWHLVKSRKLQNTSFKNGVLLFSGEKNVIPTYSPILYCESYIYVCIYLFDK